MEVIKNSICLLFIILTIIQLVGLIYVHLGKFKSRLTLVITHVDLTKVEPTRFLKLKIYATIEVLINMTLYVLFIIGNADIRFFIGILFIALPYAFEKLFGTFQSKYKESGSAIDSYR
ncbi:hypothetical protein NIE88_07020 [Sporolactobacillus shoreicorticis]|uniref:Integral membrane protein n=1 Tax=Sporolactobacillus shoreicorticis TaxID=1923877 RepID=A0ABW5S700_9BACL|nr:hypothetical protein [Sporolactobacillus shoreicorticis]MCO7125521.1 hypothetical protein [Sporolactobacillus shoreicorticis]